VCGTFCVFLSSVNLLVVLYFYVLFGSCLVVSTSAIDCLERLVLEMTCVEWDVKLYTLTHSLIAYDYLYNVMSLLSLSVLRCASVTCIKTLFVMFC